MKKPELGGELRVGLHCADVGMSLRVAARREYLHAGLAAD